jgi:hypothetical protein
MAQGLGKPRRTIMSNGKIPQENPNPHTLPGEVERANDALRSNDPGKGQRDSTAQSVGKEEVHRQQKKKAQEQPKDQSS